MEAPEKLYLSKNIYSTYQYQVPDPDDDTTVEYTCTNTFIEKACEYFRTKKKCVFACIGEDVYHSLLNEEEIEDFKTYMKGD